jgi:hypothetical protein
MPRFKPLKLMSESKSVIGLNMLTLWDERESLDELIEPLREWIDQGRLRPVVAQEFRLDDGAAAHRYLHERNNDRQGGADALGGRPELWLAEPAADARGASEANRPPAGNLECVRLADMAFLAGLRLLLLLPLRGE